MHLSSKREVPVSNLVVNKNFSFSNSGLICVSTAEINRELHLVNILFSSGTFEVIVYRNISKYYETFSILKAV